MFKTRKQSKCPSPGEELTKLRDSHATGHYATLKISELKPPTDTHKSQEHNSKGERHVAEGYMEYRISYTTFQNTQPIPV